MSEARCTLRHPKGSTGELTHIDGSTPGVEIHWKQHSLSLTEWQKQVLINLYQAQNHRCSFGGVFHLTILSLRDKQLVRSIRKKTVGGHVTITCSLTKAGIPVAKRLAVVD